MNKDNTTEAGAVESRQLFELPDSEFETGGVFNTLAVACGYASGKSWANEGNNWNRSAEQCRIRLEEEIIATNNELASRAELADKLAEALLLTIEVQELAAKRAVNGTESGVIGARLDNSRAALAAYDAAQR